MKKVMSIIAVAAITTAFVACGPSAEEKAKNEENAKRIQDSIADAITKSMNSAVEAATAPADSNAAATATPATEEKH